MYLVTANEMREMDKRTIESFGLPGRILMENAGYGAARILKNKFKDLDKKKIAVMAGRGNNGGDGFVIGRYLSQMGALVSVYLLSARSDVKGDAKENLNLLELLHIPIIEITDETVFENHKIPLKHEDMFIDAIFGIGLNAEVKGIFKHVIEFLNQSKQPVFAVDIPSGLDADTGQPHGLCVNAQLTATFAYPKIGHILYPGATCTGELHIIDIGIPPHIAAEVAPSQHLLTMDVLKNYITPRPSDAHKGTAGHLLVVSGSPGKTGAAALTAMAAMRTGAGLVTLATPSGLHPVLASQVIEVMTCPLPEDNSGRLDESSFDAIKGLLDGKKCLAIGPGLDVTTGTRKLVEKVIGQCNLPLVIDADGLNCIEGNVTQLTKREAPTILSPHPGEMARLTGVSVKSIQNNRVAIARDFAQTYQVHVILKGAKTVIAHPDGTVFLNTTGNSGMASGGMGDVLTGMVAGFMTQGYTPEASSHLGVAIHGAAADTLFAEYGPVGFIATDIIETLPLEIGKFLS